MTATMTTAASMGHFSRLLSQLSRAERARLEPFLEPVDLSFRQVLVKAEAPIAHVVFLHDAVASAVTELPGGEVVEVGVMGSEGIAGLGLLFGNVVSTTTAIVQVPGRASRMRAADFRREVVERGGESFHLLLHYANAFTGMVAHIAACNASHTVEQRFARWLLLVHDLGRREHFPLTHEFAALLLGVRRAGITEVANRLRTAGAIDYRVGEMQIRDPEMLAGIACGCYGAVTRLLHEPRATPGRIPPTA
jgi:CRP-like cAMP-binding protein